MKSDLVAYASIMACIGIVQYFWNRFLIGDLITDLSIDSLSKLIPWVKRSFKYAYVLTTLVFSLHMVTMYHGGKRSPSNIGTLDQGSGS